MADAIVKMTPSKKGGDYATFVAVPLSKVVDCSTKLIFNKKLKDDVKTLVRTLDNGKKILTPEDSIGDIVIVDENNTPLNELIPLGARYQLPQFGNMETVPTDVKSSELKPDGTPKWCIHTDKWYGVKKKDFVIIPD